MPSAIFAGFFFRLPFSRALNCTSPSASLPAWSFRLNAKKENSPSKRLKSSRIMHDLLTLLKKDSLSITDLPAGSFTRSLMSNSPPRTTCKSGNNDSRSLLRRRASWHEKLLLKRVNRDLSNNRQNRTYLKLHLERIPLLQLFEKTFIGFGFHLCWGCAAERE